MDVLLTNSKQLMVHDPLTTLCSKETIYSELSCNSEASASELIENLEVFPHTT